jgi:hypothetical protein
MSTFPYETMACNLEAGQIVSLKDTRHVVESTELGGTNVRIALVGGLIYNCSKATLVKVIGFQEPTTNETIRADIADIKAAALIANREPQKQAAPPAKLAPLGVHVNVSDIVQITNPAQHWYPCLIVVDEVFTWGIQGYALIPFNDGTGTKQAFTRLHNADFEYVGTVAIARASE